LLKPPELFLRNPANKQTSERTNADENTTSFAEVMNEKPGGGGATSVFFPNASVLRLANSWSAYCIDTCCATHVALNLFYAIVSLVPRNDVKVSTTTKNANFSR